MSKQQKESPEEYSARQITKLQQELVDRIDENKAIKSTLLSTNDERMLYARQNKQLQTDLTTSEARVAGLNANLSNLRANNADLEIETAGQFKAFVDERAAHTGTKQWNKFMIMLVVALCVVLAYFIKNDDTHRKQIDILQDNAIAKNYVKDLSGMYMAGADSIIEAMYYAGPTDTARMSICDKDGQLFNVVITKK